MKLTYPHYYPDFKCIASACTDNCCIGWEIDIDDETLSCYQAQSGEFGERLRNNISLDDMPHFLMNGERCPFLNESNLCDIIITLGEDAICEICTEHPRFHEWFGNVKESGIGLCCETAVKLIVENQAPATFVHTEIDEATISDFSEENLFSVMCDVREMIWSMLQNRSYSIWERLTAVLKLSYVIQDFLYDEVPEERIAQFMETYGKEPQVFFDGFDRAEQFDITESDYRNIVSDLLSFFIGLESMDENWKKELIRIKENLGDVLDCRADFARDYLPASVEYEHLAVYFVYRYMMKAIYSGDVLSNIKLMIVSVALISIVDTAYWNKTKSFSMNERIQIVKSYSKEIEYNEENLDRFRDVSWEEEIFSADSLLAVLANM